MGDRNLQSKPDEQYPLLKIDGGGDISHAQPTQTVVTSGWGVTCTKNSRFSRWPELISACWMTLILCGISFLVFHALGMSLYRRQQFIIMKCNNSKPASNVYYHHIVPRGPRGNQIPFVLYIEYLANMATQYPLLHFNVVFLIDDSYTDVHRLKRNIPTYHSWLFNYKLDEMGKEAYIEFQKRYQNVNVTIIPLSKYMAMTPLKYKWRLIPQSYLTFYARVFSVWQNGGIGIDLKTYNNEYHSRLSFDPRIDAILKQHNDGINTADYTKALNKIDNDEANAVFNMLYGMINHFLNETRSFFNRTLCPLVSNETTPLIRTPRSKRQTNNVSENAVITVTTDDTKTFYNIDNDTLNLTPINFTNNKNEIDEYLLNTTTSLENEPSNLTDFRNSQVETNGSKTQVILFYDFSIFSDSTGPVFPRFNVHKPSDPSKKHLLSINSEGTFIAASSRLHPFLAHLISAGCFGMLPKIAVRDALLTQCSGALNDDVYCNNIYVL